MKVDLYDLPSDDDVSSPNDESENREDSNLSKQDVVQLRQAVEQLRARAEAVAGELHTLLVRCRAELSYNKDVLEAKRTESLAKRDFVCSFCGTHVKHNRPDLPPWCMFEVYRTTSTIVVAFSSKERLKEWLSMRGMLENGDGLLVFLKQTAYAKMYNDRLTLRDVGSRFLAK
uniref:Uncharacterized protein n=1 Tax=Trichuris muris TaxID=70415 RepID=A0A5S6QTP8_TRIMR